MGSEPGACQTVYNRSMRTLFSTVAASLVLGMLFFAQAQAPKGKGKAKAPPKNLQIFTPETYRPAMDVFTASLGVECTFCHVGPGQMDLDDKPQKDIARNMIRMVREINARFPDGEQHVTCYTCHRGQTEPATAP